MTRKDEWLKAALTDDAVVVELLFRLKTASSDESTPSTPSLPLPPVWGLRLPRSKPANNFRKDSTVTRFSPTTPLSWSGGGAAASSLSDSGYDESSASRSKGGTSTNEVSNVCTTTNKRSKRKKTFTKLRDEESRLLKERVHFKRELASIYDPLEDQRVGSNNLKRIKFDLNMQSGETGITSSKADTTTIHNRCSSGMEPSTADRAQLILPGCSRQDESVVSNSCEVQEDINDGSKSGFVLPDLNMMPEEDETAGEIW